MEPEQPEPSGSLNSAGVTLRLPGACGAAGCGGGALLHPPITPAKNTTNEKRAKPRLMIASRKLRSSSNWTRRAKTSTEESRRLVERAGDLTASVKTARFRRP